MSTFKRFEDIESWQKSRTLAKIVADVVKQPVFNTDTKLRYDLKKTSGSIMDNIAEGFERGGKKEFIQFLSISKGSAGEIRSQFYRALDQELITNKQFDELYNLAEEIGKMLDGLMSYLRGSDLRGPKYK